MPRHLLSISLLMLTLVLPFTASLADEGPIPVRLEQDADGAWQLLRDGVPYHIQGAGGDASRAALAQAGANTFRTWGVGEDLEAQLDETQALGLTVVVGHWLGHPRHGFDYGDSTMLAEQKARVRRDVIRYREHPAVLLWALGNEMEGFDDGDDPRVWNHVQDLAAMVKELDPHHPIMTVTAEIGGGRVPAVNALCPDVDIMGINSYGGLPWVPERYRALGGTKPIVITEFGPPGTWEIAMTSFGAPPELTSTQKARIYAENYTRGCLEAADLCLGGFAFTWGSKIEATSTWYGMFLPSGDKLGAVDAMTEIWTGKKPANLCPEVRGFGLRGPDVVMPGQEVRVDLDIVDPEGAEVAVQWMVTGEVAKYDTWGDEQPAPLPLDGIIQESSAQGATLVFPGRGIFRLYMTASDGQGGGATANVPIKVEGEPGPVRIRMPLAVYADGEPAPWVPSGWMGVHEALEMDAECKENPHSGPTCLRFTYQAEGNWVGVAWQHPVGDWGDKPGGFDLTGAKALVFWARSSEDDVRLDVGVGILGPDKPFHDSARVERKGIKLSREWKKHTIKLEGEDLGRIKTPFYWSIGGKRRPVTIYLDDIRFEG